MIVCPVCEHPQDKGDTCDVCGLLLVQAAPVVVQVAILPELEQTAVVAGNAVGPPVTMMPELEVHRVGAVQVAAERVPDLEMTAVAGAAAAAAAPVEASTEIEQTRLVDDGVRTVVGDTMPCRYCGHVQKRANVFCERCANALPKVKVAQPEAGKGPELVRCVSCGMHGEPGRSCPSCGYFIRTPG